MKKADAAKKTPIDSKNADKKDNSSLTLPRLKFKDGSLNVYLVFVLVIFAFILGMLTNKVLYLEKELKDTESNPVAAANTDPQAAAQALPTPPQVVKVENGHLPILGNENAPVTIVEFSDLQCPFCKSFVEETYPEIKEKYIDTGKVKLYFRHYPLTSIHPNAQKAAEASECANEQGKFWEYHDLLFATQDTWSPQASTDANGSFTEYAGQLGLDTARFNSCMEEEKFAKVVEEDLSAGEKAQVDGTPAFFVNGYRLTGAQPFSEFESVIEEQLKK